MLNRTLASWQRRPQFSVIKSFSRNSRCFAYVECKSEKEDHVLEALWRSSNETRTGDSDGYQSRSSFYFLCDSTAVLMS